MFTIKIEVKKMKHRRIKPKMLPVIYGLIALVAIGGAYLVENALKQATFKDEDHYGYVTKTIVEDEVPVVEVKPTIIRPYNDTEIKILKSYYDYKADETSQQNALIYHDSTYMQNSGVAYGGKDSFDVVAILDGEVTEVKEDKLLGKIIQMKHDKDIISIYQSLSETSVKKGDTVKQGQVIGKSGTSNISTDLGSHLLFELIINGSTVNPEEYYDKLVSEI